MAAQVDLTRVKFIDESGTNLAMTRRYARAPRGERVVGSVPRNYGRNVTLRATLSLTGITATLTVEGATDGDVFRTYVHDVLAPTLRPGDLVVLDNLGAHKVSGICEAIEQCGATLLYLPPYSPDFNPIELCWSKIKTALRAAQARTREALEEAITQALATVTASDALAWFRHCGYALR